MITRTLGVILIASAVLLSACGNGNTNPFNSSQRRFINKTGHPDEMVIPRWDAETSIAANWIGVGYGGIAGAGVPDLSGNIISTPSPQLDTQVIQVAANLHGVVVESRADVPAAVINADPNCKFCPYTDPTRVIYCPTNNRGAVYCDVYTNGPLDIVVPESTPDNFGPWAIMTTLLYYCGVNTSGMNAREGYHANLMVVHTP